MQGRQSAPSRAAQEPAPVVVEQVDHRRPSDRQEVLALLKEYFADQAPEQDTEAGYLWQYLENPHGMAMTVIARDAQTGTPAGLTSLFPRRVLVAGRERVGAIGGDGYVRPAFRRRGIATQMHRAALMKMREAGIDFMYGPPEPHNLRALISAGAKVVGEVRRYARPVGAAGLGKRVPHGGMLARLAEPVLRPRRSPLHVVPLMDRPDSKLEEVLAEMTAEAAARKLVAPVYDSAYYTWRFFRSPRRAQRPVLVLDGARPVGVVAIERSGGRAALIGFLCPEARLRHFLRGLLDNCRGEDTVYLQIHTPAPALQLRLLSLGFVSRGRKAFQVHAPPDHPDREVLVKPSAWRYQWGDGDGDQLFE